MKLNLASSKRKEQTKNEGESIRRKVSSSRPLGYVFFLVIAFLLWFVQSLDREVTRSVRIPLTQDSIDFVPNGDDVLPEFVEVVVSDKLIDHILLGLDVQRPIPLRLYTPHNASPYVGIGRADLLDEIKRQLSTQARVVSVSPEEVVLPFHHRRSLRLPVALSERPNIDQGYMDTELTFVPDSIEVYATDEVAEHLTAIQVAPFPSRSIKESQAFALPIIYPNGVTGKVRNVSVRVRVEELTEQAIENLPIQARNVPFGYRLILLPSTASLRITIPRHLNGKLSDQLELYVDYADLANDLGVDSLNRRERRLSLQLDKKDHKHIYNFKIEPSSIQYILEEI